MTRDAAVLTIGAHPKSGALFFGMGSSPLHAKFVAFAVAPNEAEVRARLYDAISDALMFQSRVRAGDTTGFSTQTIADLPRPMPPIRRF